MLLKNCKRCEVEFSSYPSDSRSFCSRKCADAWKIGMIPWNKGVKTGIVPKTAFKENHVTWNTGLNISGHSGYKHSDSWKKYMSSIQKGRKNEKLSGENHWNWREDRSSLAKRQKRSDMAYKEWRRQVKNRDGWKCKMSNDNCSGAIIAHHILGWTKFPELRYEVNNGITLCHFHHPRKRNDEMKLSPYFQELVRATMQ